VVAACLEYQGTLVAADIEGCPAEMKAAEYAHRATYRHMLQLDPGRVFVVARVHECNRRSIKATARVGLERTIRESLEYWRMLGPVDPAAGCAA
jgi:hypothetical protein